METIKKYSVEELQQMALPYFKAGHTEVYATTDGQLFLSYNSARSHAVDKVHEKIVQVVPVEVIKLINNIQ